MGEQRAERVTSPTRLIEAKLIGGDLSRTQFDTTIMNTAQKEELLQNKQITLEQAEGIICPEE